MVHCSIGGLGTIVVYGSVRGLWTRVWVWGACRYGTKAFVSGC